MKHKDYVRAAKIIRENTPPGPARKQAIHMFAILFEDDPRFHRHLLEEAAGHDDPVVWTHRGTTTGENAGGHDL